MVSAIGSSSFSAPSGTGPSVASLQAQLDRYQKQLSDCVNCDTANTREGRETIQTLSSKVGEVKARIEKAAEKPGTQPSAIETGKPAAFDANRDVIVSGAHSDATAATSTGFATTAIGTRLDVFT